MVFKTFFFCLHRLLEEAFIWCFVGGVPDQQDAEVAARKAEAAEKRADDIASGAAQMNGRELFQHEPWVFDNNIYWDGVGLLFLH